MVRLGQRSAYFGPPCQATPRLIAWPTAGIGGVVLAFLALTANRTTQEDRLREHDSETTGNV